MPKQVEAYRGMFKHAHVRSLSQDNSHETLCSLRFARQVNQCDTGGGGKQAPKRQVKSLKGGSADPPAKQARPDAAGPSAASEPATPGRS